jgi:hypothetical protein
MCKAVFEEQHRHTISFALERFCLKEKNASEEAAPENAITVLSRYIGHALDNHHVREMRHRDRRNEDEVFQDTASKTAYEIYSNPRFAAANGNFRMSFKDAILRHYHNRLENDPININAVSARAASAAGISSPSAGAAGISSPSITRMVDRTCLKATRKMIDPSSTPRTKKRACIVRVALAECNQSFVSIIEDTLPACLQEALNVCLLQASLQE